MEEGNLTVTQKVLIVLVVVSLIIGLPLMLIDPALIVFVLIGNIVFLATFFGFYLFLRLFF
ncbi:MAG: hypothetical protein IJ222_04690 [Bacteroidales bacterium]|nr:hypothetical protein [Bacteroidales bacterium]